ncbi:SDR family oxidoreductase [Synechococcus sp. RSCCF101]|uniref:SDR family oxidoreductase n=1 Tax=Synechococcus sp. RSCCF101 TaxID=2511069 RepID=UPI0012478618|nr:SDR family oxidoreductase [Synechococcus sp. RSCCF101]QEY31357.1 SDR family oxidoreductase [Synechococcus sp. RSCCF101]
MPTALITGASSGIGSASCKAFAQAGWDLLITGRNAERLAGLAESLRGTGRRIHSESFDLADPTAIFPAITALLDRGGTPDAVVNNAGLAATGPLLTMAPETWDTLIRVNLTGVMQLCQAVLPAMIRAGGGLVINVSSHAARTAFPGWGGYCVSKAALDMFSRCLREEHRGDGIRVSTLTLGAVDSPLWDSDNVAADFDRGSMLGVDQAAAALLHLAQQPSSQVIEDLTLMPAAGAL